MLAKCIWQLPVKANTNMYVIALYTKIGMVTEMIQGDIKYTLVLDDNPAEIKIRLVTEF